MTPLLTRIRVVAPATNDITVKASGQWAPMLGTSSVGIARCSGTVSAS